MVYQYKSVVPLVGCLYRTYGHTDWIITVIAETGKREYLDIGICPFLDNLYPGPGDIKWYIVLLGTGNSTGMTSNTSVKVD